MRLSPVGICVAVLLLPGLHLGPLAEAAGGNAIVWDSDRVLDYAFTVDLNDTLTIAAGVNVSFRPNGSGISGGDSSPMLIVLGGLDVNGAAGARVRFSADESLWLGGNEPDCLYIISYGETDRFSVQNATFTGMVINLFSSGGQFRDCAFDRCDLNLMSSAVSFENCTFSYSTLGPGEFDGGYDGPPGIALRSCRFDGRDPASHPPPPYNYTGYDRNEPYARSAIELREPVSVEDCQITGYSIGIMTVVNSTSIKNTTVRDCGYGIVLSGVLSTDSALVQGCIIQNCSAWGIYSSGRLTLADTVVGDCGELGVQSGGDLLLANCTVYGCPTGVSLNAGASGAAPDWLLSGNRIFGCAGYAVVAEGRDVDLTGNRFDNGTVENGDGRLKVSRAVRLNLVDPAGHPVSGACELFWTDSSGGTGSRQILAGSSIFLTDHTMNNDGVRADLFPYSLQLRRGAVENRTVLALGQTELTVVLPILPDLVPVFLEPDLGSIRAGDEVRFLVRVQNPGGSIAGSSTVVFLVDGREVARGQTGQIPIRGQSSVYSHPWRATAGRHTVEARVDGPENIRENNETNNNLSVQFNVGGTNSVGFTGLYGGWNIWFAPLLVFVMMLYILLVLAVRHRRRRRREAGNEPAPAGGLEPVPARIQRPARIKCPNCGTVAEVVSPVRPIELRCETCDSRLKLLK